MGWDRVGADLDGVGCRSVLDWIGCLGWRSVERNEGRRVRS